jgi:hypothetical protein
MFDVFAAVMGLAILALIVYAAWKIGTNPN